MSTRRTPRLLVVGDGVRTPKASLLEHAGPDIAGMYDPEGGVTHLVPTASIPPAGLDMPSASTFDADQLEREIAERRRIENDERRMTAIVRQRQRPVPEWPEPFGGTRYFTRGQFRSYADRAMRDAARRSVPTRGRDLRDRGMSRLPDIVNAIALGGGVSDAVLSALEKELNQILTDLANKPAEIIANAIGDLLDGIDIQLPKEIVDLIKDVDEVLADAEEIAEILENPLDAGTDALIDAIFNDWWEADPNASAYEIKAREWLGDGLRELHNSVFSGVRGMDFGQVSVNISALQEKVTAFIFGSDPVPATAVLGAARVGDPDDKGNVVAPMGPGNVLCNGPFIATVGCPMPPDGKPIWEGSGTVLTNGLFTSRLTSGTNVPSEISGASGDVLVGGPSAGTPAPPESPVLKKPGGGGEGGEGAGEGEPETEKPGKPDGPPPTTGVEHCCVVDKMVVNVSRYESSASWLLDLPTHAARREVPPIMSRADRSEYVIDIIVPDSATVHVDTFFAKPECRLHTDPIWVNGPDGAQKIAGTSGSFEVESPRLNELAWTRPREFISSVMRPNVYMVGVDACSGSPGLSGVVIRAFPAFAFDVNVKWGFKATKEHDPFRGRPDFALQDTTTKNEIEVSGAIQRNDSTVTGSLSGAYGVKKVTDFISDVSIASSTILGWIHSLGGPKISIDGPSVELGIKYEMIEQDDGSITVGSKRTLDLEIGFGISGEVDILETMLNLLPAGKTLDLLKWLAKKLGYNGGKSGAIEILLGARVGLAGDAIYRSIETNGDEPWKYSGGGNGKYSFDAWLKPRAQFTYESGWWTLCSEGSVYVEGSVSIGGYVSTQLEASSQGLVVTREFAWTGVKFAAKAGADFSWDFMPGWDWGTSAAWEEQLIEGDSSGKVPVFEM